MSTSCAGICLPQQTGRTSALASHAFDQGSCCGTHAQGVCAFATYRPVRRTVSPFVHAGIRLLQQMGWRQGKGVGAAAPLPEELEAAAGGSGRRRGRWGRDAGLGVDNTPIYALEAKDDVHGLGFDPFKVGSDTACDCRSQQAQQGLTSASICWECGVARALATSVTCWLEAHTDMLGCGTSYVACVRLARKCALHIQGFLVCV